MLAAMLACPVGSVLAQGAAQPALSVCLQANNPPLSVRDGDTPSGFDLELSRVVAERLGRNLRVQWFVSRDDADSNLGKDANALLSDGRCDLVADYPLVADMLEPQHSPAGKLPPFEGAKPDDRRRWVKFSDLAATVPYRLDTLTVVLSPHEAGRQVGKLADLDGLNIGVQIATLADAIAMQYAGGRLIEHVVHVRDSAELFERLQNGGLDAAFTNLRAFDAWRTQQGSSGLVATGYIHSLAFNMGFVGLASDMALINAVDLVLADPRARDALAPLAARTGLTLVPPRRPAVQPDVGVAALQGD